MLITSVTLSFILLSIYGYSLLVKKIIYVGLEKNSLENFDFFLGTSILYVISFLLNIFFPLYLFSELVIIIGVGIFFFLYKDTKKNFNILLSFLILFLLVFISYGLDMVYDSALYHLQIINWITNHKISFGLSNLEIRFSANSYWQTLLALFNSQKISVQIIYIFNTIPYAILISEIFKNSKNKNQLSSYFLLCSVGLILFYSILHPDLNGTIMNSLRSPEADSVGIVLFIFSVYYFLKFQENECSLNFYSCVISSTLGVVSKFSNIGLLILPLIIFVQNSNSRKFLRLYVFCFFLGFLWLIKNYILSGCWVLPMDITCFPKSIWSTPPEEVLLYKKTIMSFPRAYSAGENIMNFKYTLESYDWIVPWIKTYLFKTGFFILCFGALILSIIFYILGRILINKNSYLIRNNFLLIGFFLLNLLIWLQSPEIRYGFGVLVTFTSYLFVIGTFRFVSHYKILNLTRHITLLLMFILSFQNIDNMKYLFKVDRIKIDYSYIKLEKKVNNYEIYKSDGNQGFCYDIKSICIIFPSNFNILNKNNYLFFLRTKN